MELSSPGLQDCLAAADTKGLAARLAAGLQALPPGTLPLHIGCTQGGLVDDHDITATVLSVERGTDRAVARVGVFFTELVGGCNCHDDPLAVNAYCELRVTLDRAAGVARIEAAAN